MMAAEGSEISSESRLAARLAALNGVAPEPVLHVIFRSTHRHDGSLAEGYSVAGEGARLDAAGLQRWLANQPGRIDPLAVAVLSIREIIAPSGLLLQCTIDHRRGGIDGPFCGDPARVEFAGPAVAVRLYRSRPDGGLVELAPSAAVSVTHLRAPEHFAAECNAVKTHFREDIAILDAREPTLFEHHAGLASIVHVRTADGREVGCGIGWHGDMAFVLRAEFPRFVSTVELSPEAAAAVHAAAQTHGLVRGETRFDEHGLAVIARRRGGEALVLLRPTQGNVQMQPYLPNRETESADQQRWMHYAETYEGLATLDAWHDGAGRGLLVLTGDPSGQVWRHHLDAEGIETWRKAVNDAAIGPLHRERLKPGALSVEDAQANDAEPDDAMGSIATPYADGSLLARADAYLRARSALRAAREAIGGATNAKSTRVRELQSALATLDVPVAAASARELTKHFDATVLAQIEERLRLELSLMRCITVSPQRAKFMLDADAPFGVQAATQLPQVTYDSHEAGLCLALRRPSAAVFHCQRIVEAAIAILARCTGSRDPLTAGERNWQTVLRLLRSASDRRFVDALNALDELRRSWCSPLLQLADKYTEEEAEQIFHAVGAFVQELARAMQEDAGQAPVVSLQKAPTRG